MPFTPDRFFTRVTQIDIERYRVPWREMRAHRFGQHASAARYPPGSDDIRAWLKALSAAGVRVCILTNNWHHGAHEWAQRLGLPIVSHAIKPLPFAYALALRKMGARRRETLCIGDQLITDVEWAFHAHAGVYGRAARFGRSEAHVAFAPCGSAVHEEYAPREIMHRWPPQGRPFFPYARCFRAKFRCAKVSLCHVLESLRKMRYVARCGATMEYMTAGGVAWRKLGCHC